jgi:hypothetical protein
VRLDDDWEWRRWQLVRVDHDDDEVVVDAIELLDGRLDPLDPLDEQGGLVTLSFASDAAEPGQETPLAPLFERWAVRDSGLCDAFYRPCATGGYMVMLQGPESVIVPVSAGR